MDGPAIETQTLVPLTERVNVQADSACVNQIIDGCWVAVGAKKAHAIQRDFNLMFNGKPSYRFELKEDDNTLSGYAAGETKGRAEFSYCYATSDDFKGKPADTYKKAQIMKTVYHHGKGICPQGASRDYEFSVYIPSTLGSEVSSSPITEVKLSIGKQKRWYMKMCYLMKLFRCSMNVPVPTN